MDGNNSVTLRRSLTALEPSVLSLTDEEGGVDRPVLEESPSLLLAMGEVALNRLLIDCLKASSVRGGMFSSIGELWSSLPAHNDSLPGIEHASNIAKTIDCDITLK